MSQPLGLKGPVLHTVNLGADIVLATGQDTILDATGPGLTYVWSTGAATATILVNTPGTYSVTVTTAEGCTGSDMVEVTIASSIFSPQPLVNILVAPNPTHDLLHITCAGTTITPLQVFDNLGRLMLADDSFKTAGTVQTIDLSMQQPGVYYVRIADANGAWTFRVVKQ